jgi:uncharacterized protein
VTVTVTGRAAAPPDVLVLGLAAEGQARDVSRALDTASRSLSAMVDRLRQAGVADRDLRTQGATLWSRTDDRGRAVGYVATQRLTATLRDLPAAGDLVPAVVAAGGQAARLDGLRFAVDDDAALLRAARDDAWDRARAVAAQHAGRAGRALGQVLRVRETAAAPGGGPPVRPMAFRAGAEAMPTEGGEHEVTVTIEVEWAFSP